LLKPKRVLAPLAVIVAVVVGFVVVTPSVSFAGVLKDYKNVATLECLDSNSAGSVYTLTCNPGNNQRWNESFKTYGYELRNYATNRCLDDDVAAGRVKTNPCNGGSYQQWTRGSSPSQLRNVATLECLDDDVSAGVLKTNPCNGGNFQRWTMSGSVIGPRQAR
jgi:serine/threonine-protein kinase